MDCGNIVEISMRTIDEVNAKRKLEIMDATTVFGFVFVKQRKKKKKIINGIVCGGCRALETSVQVYIMCQCYLFICASMFVSISILGIKLLFGGLFLCSGGVMV